MTENLEEFTVRIPLPPRVLYPNVKSHWSVKAKAAEKSREEAKQIYLKRLENLGIAAPHWTQYEIELIVTYYNNRYAPDLDGTLSACKHLLDALQDVVSPKTSKHPLITGAGIVKNDKFCRRLIMERNVNQFDYGITIIVRPLVNQRKESNADKKRRKLAIS